MKSSSIMIQGGFALPHNSLRIRGFASKSETTLTLNSFLDQKQNQDQGPLKLEDKIDEGESVSSDGGSRLNNNFESISSVIAISSSNQIMQGPPPSQNDKDRTDLERSEAELARRRALIL